MSVINEIDLADIVKTLCMTVFGMPVDEGLEEEVAGGDPITASIAISGEWTGVVKIRACKGFLDRAASLIFTIDLNAVDRQDRIDTVTELTNMLGGSVKCMLPEPCELALPEIVPSEQVTRSEHEWAYFKCDEMPMAVAVIERHTA